MIGNPSNPNDLLCYDIKGIPEQPYILYENIPLSKYSFSDYPKQCKIMRCHNFFSNYEIRHNLIIFTDVDITGRFSPVTAPNSNGTFLSEITMNNGVSSMVFDLQERMCINIDKTQ